MTFALADCNNFYVSCERAFNPALQGRPVVVLSSNDGCIIARSQEAKAAGITMGLPLFKAQPLIRKLKVAVLSSNYALYADMSRRVMDTMLTFPVKREVYSIDEAFLELPAKPPEELNELCRAMRQRILKWTGIPVSIGIGETKTLAKLANRMVKITNSQTGVVNLQHQPDADAAMAAFPAGEVWGVGRKIAKALERSGITTAAQLRDADQFWLRKEFSIKGLALALELQGQVCYRLQENTPARKEIIVSRTFGRRLQGFNKLAPAFEEFARHAADRLTAAGMQTKSVTAFLGTDPFQADSSPGASVELTLETATADPEWLVHFAREALGKIADPSVEYKKGAVILGELTTANIVQDTLFNAAADAAGLPPVAPPKYKSAGVRAAMEAVTAKHGSGGIALGKGQPTDAVWEQRRDYISPRYTTRCSELPVVK